MTTLPCQLFPIILTRLLLRLLEGALLDRLVGALLDQELGALLDLGFLLGRYFGCLLDELEGALLDHTNLRKYERDKLGSRSSFRIGLALDDKVVSKECPGLTPGLLSGSIDVEPIGL